MTDSADIRATIERYVATWNTSDAAAMTALFAEGAFIEDPIGTGVHEGLAAIETQYGSAFGIVEATLRLTGAIRVAGLEAAFPMEVEIDLGEQTGRLAIIDTMTFDEAGKITSMRAYCDQADLVIS